MVAIQSGGVIEQASTQTDTPEWVRAHEQLSRLAKMRAAFDAEEGRWLLCALRSAAHVHLGFGSFLEYVGRLFGYRSRSTQEKLRVAEALEQMPEMYEALESGTLSWSAARELTRVATPETAREWLDAARGKTTHQLEALVAGKAPGDRPASPSRAELRRHVLRFEVSTETLALFRDALAKLRRGTDHRIDDDAALLLMARHVLAGPKDDGRAPYQVALTICQECGKGFQQAGAELLEIGSDVVAMAQCDCQQLGRIDTPDSERAHTGGARDDALDAVVSETAQVRATQSIPPALRRTVLRRDHHRCVVPGCTQSMFLDIHHIRPRSAGGKNEARNLATLCSAHHRAQHRGELNISGGAPNLLAFVHADGTVYGERVAARSADAFSKAFAALRAMGFRENQVRQALDVFRTQTAGSALNAEAILREALMLLTPASS